MGEQIGNTNDSVEEDVDREIGRRELLKMTGAGAALVGAVSLASSGAFAQYNDAWDKTFPKSDRVDQRKVTYTNRLGIPLVADLYIPKKIDRARKHAALVVGHPFGGVKEQASGLYAQMMAEHGFITLAHDASFNGESGGHPRFISSPDVFVEDFSAGIDFLGTHPLVDRARIGAIGVCASGGFVLAAAQIDPRIKAVATASMYDMGSERREGLGRTMSDSDRRDALKHIGEQRWTEFAGGKTEYYAMPESLPADAPAVLKEFFDYYHTPRGRHPRSMPAVSITSNGSLMQFRPLDHVEWISPRPVLLIAGEHAHSRYFSEEAYQRAAEPRELYIVKGAGHVDLYDRVNLIPFDKLTAFFNDHLKA